MPWSTAPGRGRRRASGGTGDGRRADLGQRRGRRGRLPRSVTVGKVRAPRLIATDLDGTLIGRDRVISRRSAKVLAQAVASGIAVVLVTGRPLRWIFSAYEQLAAGYPTICANGAVEYDPDTDTVLASHPLPPSDLA